MLIKKSTSVTRGCSLLIPLCVAVKVTAIFWFFFLKHTLQTSFPHSPVEYEIVKRHPSTKQNKHTVISLNTKPTDRWSELDHLVTMWWSSGKPRVLAQSTKSSRSSIKTSWTYRSQKYRCHCPGVHGTPARTQCREGSDLFLAASGGVSFQTLLLFTSVYFTRWHAWFPVSFFRY